MRTILIRCEANLKNIVNFKPDRFFFGKRKETSSYFIGCHYRYGKNSEHFCSKIIATTAKHLQGTHKIIGFDEHYNYIKLRELNIETI